MFRAFNASVLFVTLSCVLGGAAQAVTFNTFTAPPPSMTLGKTIGFAFAGEEFVGSIDVNGTNTLYSTNLSGGNAQPFAPSVNLTSTTGEHYVAASFGLGGFPNGDIYAADGTSITHITNNGASSNTFVSGLSGDVRGITFDLFGTYGYDMLVTTSAGEIYKVNSTGAATALANVGEDVEGLDIAPPGGNFATFDGQLIVASEGSGMLCAISPLGVVTPLSNGSSNPVIVPSAEELTFVPLALTANPLEGLYGSNYGPDNVQRANENQFLGLQGDIIVTGELTGNVSDVHWNGSQFVVTNVGSFGSYPSNQPEDGVFVTPAMIPEPSSFALAAAGLISIVVLRVRSRFGRRKGTSADSDDAVSVLLCSFVRFFPQFLLLRRYSSMYSFPKFSFVSIVFLTVICGFAGLSPGNGITQDGGQVTGLWNTGVDNSGNPLPDTTVEGHYSIGQYVYASGAPGPSQFIGGNYVYSGTNGPSFVSSGSAGTGFPAGSSALIIAATATGDAPYTLPPLNLVSEWIGPGSSSSTGVAPGGLQQNGPSDLSGTTANGYYDFETTFNLTTAGSFTISGSFSADNRVIDTIVDGVSTGIGSTCSPSHDYGSAYYNTFGPDDFAQWTPFTLSGTGSLGTNDLDFIVWNSSPALTALRVEFTPVPEPGTLALLGTGAVGLLGFAWRRRRSQRNRAEQSAA